MDPKVTNNCSFIGSILITIVYFPGKYRHQDMNTGRYRSIQT